MKNAFRVFFVDVFLVFTGRESEVRANQEPSEHADLFAIFLRRFLQQIIKNAIFTSIKKSVNTLNNLVKKIPPQFEGVEGPFPG